MSPKDQILQFSKSPVAANYGELPFGDIPEPLKYTRPFRKYPLSSLRFFDLVVVFLIAFSTLFSPLVLSSFNLIFLIYY